MLTEFITKRFCKHHSQLLAYMDAIEEVVRDISDSPNPGDEFTHHHRLLTEFLDFMETRQLPHEREEEKILLPVLERRLRESPDRPFGPSMLQVCREHDGGRRLVVRVRERFMELNHAASPEVSGYYDLTATLTELIWHYRRHVWEEDSVILPTVEKLIPPTDPIWATAERPARE